MKVPLNRYIQIVLLVFSFILTSTPVWSQEETTTAQQLTTTQDWVSPKDAFVYIIVSFISIASLLSVLFVRVSLEGTKWSLADALSEVAEVTATKTDADKVTKPVLDKSEKPLMIKELRASSSRLVALMGMIVILMMFIGFGTFALFSFAKTGKMPSSVDDVVKFLAAGLTLFAPYVVNKFSSMFESLTPKKG